METTTSTDPLEAATAELAATESAATNLEAMAETAAALEGTPPPTPAPEPKADAAPTANKSGFFKKPERITGQNGAPTATAAGKPQLSGETPLQVAGEKMNKAQAQAAATMWAITLNFAVSRISGAIASEPAARFEMGKEEREAYRQSSAEFFQQYAPSNLAGMMFWISTAAVILVPIISAMSIRRKKAAERAQTTSEPTPPPATARAVDTTPTPEPPSAWTGEIPHEVLSGRVDFSTSADGFYLKSVNSKIWTAEERVRAPYAKPSGFFQKMIDEQATVKRTPKEFNKLCRYHRDAIAGKAGVTSEQITNFVNFHKLEKN